MGNWIRSSFPAFSTKQKMAFFELQEAVRELSADLVTLMEKNATHLDLPIHPAQRDPEEVQCRL